MAAIQSDPRYMDSLLWHYTNLNDIQREKMAQQYGVQSYRAWPGAPAPVVNNYYPPQGATANATASAPSPASGGWLKPLALAGLIGTVGGGGLAAGGWYLGDKINSLPASVPTAKPQQFDIGVQFNPDAGGLRVGPAVPVPTKAAP